MKIVIISAMDVEIEYLITKLNNKKEIKYHSYTFYEGVLEHKDVVIARAGIGKVASGMIVASILSYYKDVDIIINVGVSGGILGMVEVGDVVIADSLKYADVDVTIFPKYAFGQIPGFPATLPTISKRLNQLNLDFKYKKGMILSGDKFYNNHQELSSLIDKYFKNDKVLAIDMESAALGQACYSFGINYLVIRGISDVIGGNKQLAKYEESVNFSSKNANLLLLEIIKKL